MQYSSLNSMLDSVPISAELETPLPGRVLMPEPPHFGLQGQL